MADLHWQNKLRGDVVVLMGGTASERDVSLRSGAEVVRGLAQLGIAAKAIDTASDLFGELTREPPALAFIAVHGAGGEDGKLQALLEHLQIPYTGSGVLASALAMDKLRSKHVWRGLGLPTPAYALLDDAVEIGAGLDRAVITAGYKKMLDKLGGQVFVKPVAEGSSFGMSIARSVEQLEQAHITARGYGQPVLVESLVNGPEYTVAILNGRCLPAIRIETSRSFYDFDAKYADDATQFYIPSGLSAQREQQLQKLALDAFNALGCSGWGRVDIMCDAASGEFFLLEANTVPGLTDHSLVPMAAAAAGLSFADLIGEICRAALQDVSSPDSKGTRQC